MLIRPEILRLMKDGKIVEEDSKVSALERAKRARINMKGTKTFAPQQVTKLDGQKKKSNKESSIKKMNQIQEGLSKEQQEEQQKRQHELQMQKRKNRHEKLM